MWFVLIILHTKIQRSSLKITLAIQFLTIYEGVATIENKLSDATTHTRIFLLFLYSWF